MLVMFFFFKQKTAYEMRISDWSSDVCSSDLLKTVREMTRAMLLDRGFGRVEICDDGAPALAFLDALAADRKSVVSGKSVSVRVDLGGRRIIKIKKEQIDTLRKSMIYMHRA